MSETFKDGVCRKLGWSPEQYEEKLFWRGLSLHAKIPALLLWSQRATIFKEDFELLREVAPVTCHEVFRMEINRFFGRNRREGSWIRRGLGVRISGKKLMRLKNDLGVFSDEAEPVARP